MQRSMVAAAAVASVLVACSQTQNENGRNENGNVENGNVALMVQAISMPADVASMTVDVTPDDVQATLIKNPADGTFGLTLNLPGGDKTFSVRAWDAASNVIGVGSADATVTPGETVQVTIRVLGTNPPPPLLGPVITSFVAPARINVNASGSFSATAQDPDGDTVSFQWSATCSGVSVGGFSAPAAASTDWTAPAAAGTCNITLVVTAGGATASDTATVSIYDPNGPGNADITATFVPRPKIQRISMWPHEGSRTGANDCIINRTDANATCGFVGAPGGQWDVEVNVDAGGAAFAVEMTDNCGGSFVESFTPADPNSRGFVWYEPANAGWCTVAAVATANEVSDLFRVAVLLVGCPEDGAEENDTAAEQNGPDEPVVVGTPLGSPTFWLNDDDWFGIPIGSGNAMTVTATSAVAIDLEIYDPTGVTRIASGTGSVTATVSPGSTYLLRVVGQALPPETCGPSYVLELVMSAGDASQLSGPWIGEVVEQSATFYFYMVADGQGLLWDVSSFRNPDPAGVYVVYPDNTFEMTIYDPGYPSTFVNGSLITRTFTGFGGPDGGAFSGTMQPVTNPGACAGTWTGTLSQMSPVPGSRAISFTVDGNGRVTGGSIEGLSVPLTGRALYCESGLAVGFVASNGAPEGTWYDEVQLSGTVSGTVITGTFEADGADDLNGTFTLTRE